MKRVALIPLSVYIFMALATFSVSAQETLSLWPEGFLQNASAASEKTLPDKGDGVTRITEVTMPSLTLYPAPDSDTPTPAVLICPGGGYRILAFNKEGTELAEWFNTLGIRAMVLKYRVPDNRAGALQDAQRAIGLIRQHASDWNIDPEKIGVMGFSAGGHLAATLSNIYEKRTYTPVDEADTRSCRPDFTMLIYPAYLDASACELKDEFEVTRKTSPCFLVQTQDDKNYVNSSIAYYLACKEARVPAELHLYPAGGHGYGMRPSKHAVSKWPDLCKIWLQGIL